VKLVLRETLNREDREYYLIQVVWTWHTPVLSPCIYPSTVQ
jgi:hypothetical protein